MPIDHSEEPTTPRTGGDEEEHIDIEMMEDQESVASTTS